MLKSESKAKVGDYPKRLDNLNKKKSRINMKTDQYEKKEEAIFRGTP